AVPQSFMIEKQALEEYKNAVVEQRNALGAQLEQATASVESEKKAREDLAAKLQMLQGQIMASLGKKVKGQGAQADDPEVVLARKRHEWRKAQLRLKQQKKKEAKMREDAARLEEEKKQIEEEA
ncbi:unnamed protein product, partial [Symbiodinium sp. KB8]